MSWLTDSTELVAGGWLSSQYAGNGVLGSAVPATGEHGPSILFPGLSLPAEANDEFRLVVLTRPAGLSFLQINEDGSLEAEGPPGSYVGTWEGFKNFVSYGTSTYTINIGDSGQLSGGPTLSDIAVAGGFSAPAVLSGGLQLDSLETAGFITSGVGLAGAGTLLDVEAAGGFEGGCTLSGAIQLADIAAAGGASGLPPDTLLGDAVLDSLVLSGSFGVESLLSGGAVLGDLLLSGYATSVPLPPTIQVGARLSRILYIGPESGVPKVIQTPAFDFTNPRKPTTTKDPDSTLDYVFDWTAWLAEVIDSIESVEFILSSSLVKVSESNTNTTATIFLAGGDLNQSEQVTCRITTAGGRVEDMTIHLRIRNK